MSNSKSKKEPVWRRMVKWVHLWLGLASGLVVFLVSLSGVLFVFHEEVNNFINKDVRVVVVPENPVRISPDTILANLRKQYPEAKGSFYTEYADRSMATKILCRIPNKANPMLGVATAYANPYTGKILKMDNTHGYFRLIVAFHMNLLLGSAGSQLVRISTIIFLIEIITGIIWWWPKKWNNSTRNKSFKIKWNATWKRLNIDLHNVLGFYSLPLGIILVVTGLMLSYKPVKDFFFWTFGYKGGENSVFQSLPRADSLKTALPLDRLLLGYQKQLGQYEQLTIDIPSPRSGAVAVRMEHESSLLTYRGKQEYLDVYKGTVIKNLAEQAVQEVKMKNTTVSLHIGTWYGLPAKIFTFIVCLICTSLPVTGFIIWYNRKFKKKKTVA